MAGVHCLNNLLQATGVEYQRESVLCLCWQVQFSTSIMVNSVFNISFQFQFSMLASQFSGFNCLLFDMKPFRMQKS